MNWFTRLFRLNGEAYTEPGHIPGVLPNFFIAGAARSGTTSMWQYLRQHPDICMPLDMLGKEPAFFCNNNRTFGLSDRHQYLALFAKAGKKRRIGEASTAYLTSPESPGRIRQEIPHARFIILLRNPAERSFSMYKWMHKHGYEKLPTFAEALEAENQVRFGNEDFINNNGQYYHNFLYFHSSLYHPKLLRFFDTFGRKQVHVLIFEEFARNPLASVRSTYEFLGVDPSFTPKIAVHNASAPEYGQLDLSLRQSLLKRCADDIAQVSQLLGRDLKSLWV